jgi:hypothetical protein
VTRLSEITTRLEEITRELGSEETDDDRAGELTREAAMLAAEASEEVSRSLRQAEVAEEDSSSGE